MPNQNFKSARSSLAKGLSRFMDEPEAQAESWRWFEEGLGWGRARMHAHGEELITADIENQLDTWFNRRKNGEPWAYILGWAIWRRRRFRVTPATLIPRPETEMVFESALWLAEKVEARRVVDVGTGAGILGITFALDTQLGVTATDISVEALSIAKKNALDHGANLDWIRGDLLEPVSGPLDLVISNPPYIAPEDEATLQREISFEPRTALFAEDHGMAIIKRLLEQGIERKVKGLVTEIGSGQGSEVKSSALKMGWRCVEIKKDIAGHDRALIATC
ncbi:MAG: peptide chain release factor N(5)-glutamine methyltransferase [Holophagaceae bacterium]|nr:peptide chain release factor N(5)-glutamine methyltransferase [Holophagaceae bacterium]